MTHFQRKTKRKGDDLLMSQFKTGLDALNALTTTPDSGSKSNNEITPFQSGDKRIIKIISKGDVQRAYAYRHAKKGVNSFIAKNPSDKSEKGYVTGNPTSWDKVANYYRKKSEKFGDDSSQLAYVYSAKARWVFAFYDLTDGKVVLIDFTGKQAREKIATVITKYEKKLDKLAFELTKEGDGLNTVVTLSPIIDMDDDLTDKQRDNFEKAPESIDHSVFNGIWFEKSDEEMVTLLRQTGFDISLIGLGDAPSTQNETGEDTPIEDEEPLPF